MRTRLLSFLTLLIFLLSTADSAFANLLGNGGFEAPVITSPLGYQTITLGSEPNGFTWRVLSGNVDITADGAFGIFRSFEGRQFLDLDGTTPGAVAQSIPTTPGTTLRSKLRLCEQLRYGSDSTGASHNQSL
jgi:hypothetical protein